MSTEVNYMQLMDPSVIILTITPDAERHIEKCARICYNSLDKMTDDSCAGFLRGALKRGHFSLLSHAHMSVVINGISRACSHQLVRHAHLRYLQRSQRYCSEADSSCVVPPAIAKSNEKGFSDEDQFNMAMGDAFAWYAEFIEHGHKREDARYVLPNACKTTIVVSGSLQAWFDFLRLRMDKHAQWEIRDVAKMVYGLLNAHCPNIFNEELLVLEPRRDLEFPEV